MAAMIENATYAGWSVMAAIVFLFDFIFVFFRKVEVFCPLNFECFSSCLILPSPLGEKVR